MPRLPAPFYAVAASLLLAGAGCACAQSASLVTVVTNGPASNRFNVVFLSEGYTAGQLGQFLADVTNQVNALFARQPFAEYAGYFNVYAISVASAQSGSDHPSWPQYRDTYFNSSYDAVTDKLITIPANASGQGRVNTLVSNLAPACQLSILLVNDFITGGSDGSDQTAIASMFSSEVLIHEIGHVVAGLGDETTSPYPGYPDIEEPNTTRETNRNLVKWRAWIAPATPVPTPAEGQYNSVVGLFEGAHYHTTGWYRPKIECSMASIYSPAFCEVCNEALVLALYGKVRPVNSASPSPGAIAATSPQPVGFTLGLLQPATHSLSVQWFTNGVAVLQATNNSYNLLPASLGSGSHTISVVVTDPTDMVRTDPTLLLRQTVAWTVNVNLPQLTWGTPLWLPGGKFACRITGTAPQGFAIQTSTNLASWTSMQTNTLSGGQYWFTNTAPGAGRLFYRAKTPP